MGSVIAKNNSLEVHSVILENQTKEEFVREQGSKVREALEKVEARDANFWDKLVEIDKAFTSALHFETDMQCFVRDLGIQPFFHSVRYRKKSEKSLLVKIITKSAGVPDEITGNPDVEKYRDINKDNYRAILTDLIGVRILYRYPYQWTEIHKFLKERFFPGNNFVNNYIQKWGVKSDLDVDIPPYLAKRPKIYTSKEDKFFFEKIKGIDRVYLIENSEGCYNSTHYVIKYQNSFIELQVRTILDEVWGECSHDFLYKPIDGMGALDSQMENYLEILSAQNHAAMKTIEKMCRTQGYSLDKMTIDEEKTITSEPIRKVNYNATAFKEKEQKAFGFDSNGYINFWGKG